MIANNGEHETIQFFSAHHFDQKSVSRLPLDIISYICICIYIHTYFTMQTIWIVACICQYACPYDRILTYHRKRLEAIVHFISQLNAMVFWGPWHDTAPHNTVFVDHQHKNIYIYTYMTRAKSPPNHSKCVENTISVVGFDIGGYGAKIAIAISTMTSTGRGSPITK